MPGANDRAHAGCIGLRTRGLHWIAVRTSSSPRAAKRAARRHSGDVDPCAGSGGPAGTRISRDVAGGRRWDCGRAWFGSQPDAGCGWRDVGLATMGKFGSFGASQSPTCGAGRPTETARSAKHLPTSPVAMTGRQSSRDVYCARRSFRAGTAGRRSLVRWRKRRVPII